MARPKQLIECQVVSYRGWITGKREIVGLKGEVAIAFHYMLHPKTEILEYCYHDLLEWRIRYWREILMKPVKKEKPTQRLRWDWRTMRFVERVKQQKNMRIDHIAIMPEGSLSTCYIAEVEDVDHPVPLWRAIEILVKDQ